MENRYPAGAAAGLLDPDVVGDEVDEDCEPEESLFVPEPPDAGDFAPVSFAPVSEVPDSPEDPDAGLPDPDSRLSVR